MKYFIKKLEAACYCSKGYVRENNEDNFYFNGSILPQGNNTLKKVISVKLSNKEPAVFGVFDGMGGQENGQAASYLAAEILKNDCKNLANPIVSPENGLKNIMMHMNDQVWKNAELQYGKMGTTAVILYFCNGNVFICNVGDSKAFRLYGGELQQISEDHTDKKMLERLGVVGRSPRLRQYIGISPDEMVIEPYIKEYGLQPKEQYLICSDGLTDMVSDIEICKIMKESRCVKKCVRKLVQAALEYGGRDNVTVIAISVR